MNTLAPEQLDEFELKLTQILSIARSWND